MSSSKILWKYWYSVLASFSTAALLVFFPASHVYIPWILVAAIAIGSYKAVSNLQREKKEIFQRHATELAEAKRRPYTEAQRSEAQRRVKELPEQHRETLRVILFDYPITVHNLAGRLGVGVDTANSIIAALRSTDFIMATPESSQASYSIKEQYGPVLKDLLFSNEAGMAAKQK